MKKQIVYFRMIISSLIRCRSRMLVALLAVAIGVAVLSGLVTIYYDIPRQMGQEFRSYGANLTFVSTGGDSAISEEEIKKATELISAEDIVGIAPYRYETIKINKQPFMAVGTDLGEVEKTSPYWSVSGAWPAGSGSALIGQEVADLIDLLPGSSFTMTDTDSTDEGFGRDFTVSGIVQTGGAEEAFLFLSLSNLESLMGNSGELDVIECSISAPQATLERIVRQVGENVKGVTSRLVEYVADSEGAVLTKLQALVYLVTVVALLLTMVCVATTMMAAVAERHREIGLKKALGALNQSIVVESLGEGLFLGALGRLMGVALGFAFAQTVSMNVFTCSTSFRPLLIPATLAVSIAVTGLTCLISVRNITDVNPTIVLCGE